MHLVAHDHKFLEESLENTIKVDEFTGKLYEIYETVRKEGFRQVSYTTGLIMLWMSCARFKVLIISKLSDCNEAIESRTSSFGSDVRQRDLLRDLCRGPDNLSLLLLQASRN